ncbi:TPA_asm: hypothetical protein vir335_00048 [Classicovirus victor]|uniref:Uncharacterized protein n=1 Tax=Caudoviricetes sp. vir335 TaxID=3068357 RepID=A0AA87CDD3_9CAUD|nr:TPA_asm: hypothetical protein vir335_00048 [Caudoviricetes sp. vir335]
MPRSLRRRPPSETEGLRPLQRCDRMTNEYLLTNCLHLATNGTPYLSIPKLWDMDEGDLVDVILIVRDSDEVLQIGRKTVANRGGSQCIYVPKSLYDTYDLKGKMLNISVRKVQHEAA